jgi:dCMP deaminase
VNGRPTRLETIMDVAELFASRSTCDRLHVGAVFSIEGRIVATGYNGAPAGIEHCPAGPHDGPCRNAIHAEQNAVAFAANAGVALRGSTLVTTHMPCLNCALMLVNTGIVGVVYNHAFRDTSGIELLMSVNIYCRSFGIARAMEE